jgi:predicted helicase
VLNEMSVRSPFGSLLQETARLKDWTFIAELSGKSGGAIIRPDGTLRDRSTLPRGYWEAKDTQDDLDTEIKKKIARGYPLSNIIFEDTQTGVLFQNKQKINGPYTLGNPKDLVALLNQFFSHTEPAIEEFEEAVNEFKERAPDLARGLVEKIQQAHKDNARFQAAFEKFFDLCRTALNPNIRVQAVDEMLVQHLLTERLIRTVFNNPEFAKRNAIAAEVERVIDALVSKSFDRAEFQKSLDRFYVVIESTARLLPDFSEKQHFLNTVYERFFQGYAVKVADTHGIVYTPQEIVNFMCASVAEVLEKEFGKSLSSPGVYIIDPCTGTGNFVVNLLRRMPGRDLPRVYREQLFANEVMLLPYYIASLNIEHAYYELTGTYEPFEGLCFVDTLDLAEGSQHSLGFMTQKNAERVERQRRTPITVVIGNPPYNMNQQNENDNNKNRKYEVIDRRVAETYAHDSSATNKGALSDPYVKFFRWATDRLQGRDGIVAFVSNNSFVDQFAYDGMRKHLLRDFSNVYHIDLHGSVRRNPKLSGTTHNVFGIQVGVGITVAVRKQVVAPTLRSAPAARKGGHVVAAVSPPPSGDQRSPLQSADLKVGATSPGDSPGLRYYRVPENWRKEQKLAQLVSLHSFSGAPWQPLNPDISGNWLVPEHAADFEALLPIGNKASKAGASDAAATIFKVFSRGVATCRDEVAYDFDKDALRTRIRQFIDGYNGEVDRYKRSDGKQPVDDFVDYDKIKWSRDLKLDLRRGNYATFDEAKVRLALYRPFCHRWLFFDRILNEEVYVNPSIFPTPATESENRIIVTSDLAFRSPTVSALVVPTLADLHVCAAVDAHQSFPFYVYDEDGTNRRENITDWALEHFREHNNDKKITKWNIFYYVYGLLHHPEYRTKYAENLKRELPRIPLARDFWGFSNAGKELARLHTEYETLEPWPLKFIETSSGLLGADVAASLHRHGGVKPPLQKAERHSALQIPLSYRVEDKMRLAKDHRSLRVNDSLTLGGIPPETFEYRLGNRSAFEWVIDQYQVTEDKHSGIRSDPNRPDDPEYILRLVGQVIRVSLETVKLVKSLPAL